MAVETLLTCWPPGPEARTARTCTSASPSARVSVTSIMAAAMPCFGLAGREAGEAGHRAAQPGADGDDLVDVHPPALRQPRQAARGGRRPERGDGAGDLVPCQAAHGPRH